MLVFCIIAGVNCDFSQFFRTMDIDPDSSMNLSQVKTVTSSQMKVLTFAHLANMLRVDIESRLTTNLVSELRSDINHLMGGVGQHHDLEHKMERAEPFRPVMTTKTGKQREKNKSRKAENRLRLRMFNRHHRNNGRKQ